MTYHSPRPIDETKHTPLQIGIALFLLLAILWGTLYVIL